MENNVKQWAIIEKIEGNTICVRMVQKSACSSCSAKGHCNASESKEKVFQIENTTGEHYVVGQRVMCSIQASLGLKAVFLAFFLPFFVMLTAMILCIHIFHLDEGYTALIALGTLTIYYTLLYISRKQLNKTFALKLEQTA